jgi:hypothetical protein
MFLFLFLILKTTNLIFSLKKNQNTKSFLEKHELNFLGIGTKLKK